MQNFILETKLDSHVTIEQLNRLATSKLVVSYEKNNIIIDCI